MFQFDVVFGLVTLDQVDLQQQRFLVRFGYDRFETVNVRDQQLRFAFVLAVEVRFYAILQIFGLADVDDFVILVPHDVAAGQVGQQRQFLVDFFSAHPFQSFYFWLRIVYHGWKHTFSHLILIERNPFRK